MAASFELPSTLRHALSAFAFTGKPLWTMSGGRRNVKIEITLLLQDENQQQQRQPRTNQQIRAVPAALPRIQPPAQPQRETPPPTSEVIARQPATVTAQRPASSAAITPSPTVHRQLPTVPPTKHRKPTRTSTPEKPETSRWKQRHRPASLS